MCKDIATIVFYVQKLTWTACPAQWSGHTGSLTQAQYSQRIILETFQTRGAWWLYAVNESHVLVNWEGWMPWKYLLTSPNSILCMHRSDITWSVSKALGFLTPKVTEPTSVRCTRTAFAPESRSEFPVTHQVLSLCYCIITATGHCS